MAQPIKMSPQQAPHKPPSLWKFLVVLVIVVVGVPLGKSVNVQLQSHTCNHNLEGMYLAALSYSADFNDRLPSASRWTDQISPYCSGDGWKPILHCPSLPQDEIGYAMNQDLSGQQAYAESERKILFFETAQTGPNVHSTLHDVLQVPRHEAVWVVYMDQAVERPPRRQRLFSHGKSDH